MTTALLKSVAERLAVSSGALPAGRWRRRRRVLVLAYHNVVPDELAGIGDASLHLPESKFKAQIERLEQTHDIVSLDEALDRPNAAAERPRAVLTFDDGYRGAVLLGLAELARRGHPATVFLVPGAVGGSGFWWDRYRPDGGGWDEAVRSDLLTRLRGQAHLIDAWAKAQGIPLAAASEWLGVATEAELRAAAGRGSVTFGCHTWSHPNLAALEPPAVRDELLRARDWITERFDRTVAWVSYPYGLATERVEAVVQDLGFRAALAVAGGWWPARPDSRFRLPRWNVTAGLSLAGFEIRTAGFACR